MFEMRIYPPEYSWKKLVEQCRISSADANPFADSTKGQDIDIHKLNSLLRDLPIDEIQQRRRTLEVFYQEILLSAKRTDRGIGFIDLLMTLAHYKIIDNNKSLRLEEFLRRRARLGIVDDEVRRKIVKDFISTIYHRTRFLRKQDSQRASRILTVPQLQVPEIFVEDEDDSDRASTAGSARARPALTLTIPPNDEAAWRASGTDARDTPTSAGLRNRTESFSPRESPTRPSISPTRPSFQSQRSFQISPQLSPWRPSSSLPPSHSTSPASSLRTTGSWAVEMEVLVLVPLVMAAACDAVSVLWLREVVVQMRLIGLASARDGARARGMCWRCWRIARGERVCAGV